MHLRVSHSELNQSAVTLCNCKNLKCDCDFYFTLNNHRGKISCFFVGEKDLTNILAVNNRTQIENGH